MAYSAGLVTELAALEIMSPADAATCSDTGVCRPGEAAGVRLVRVTVSLALPATAGTAVPLDIVAGTATGISLAIGADHLLAPIDCGNLAETTVLCTDNSASVPTEVVPGGVVLLCESFDVPAVASAVLDVTVRPPVSDADGTNPLPPASFPDVGWLLPG
jgi:hypothetical protein